MHSRSYSKWLPEAERLPARHPLSSWRQRAAALEGRFGDRPLPEDTSGREPRPGFETVKWLGLALAWFLVKDSKGPQLSLEAALARLTLSIDDFPERLLEHLTSESNAELHGSYEASSFDCTAERVSSVRSLRHVGDSFQWSTSLTKELRFHRLLQRPFTSSVWPNRRWKRPTDAPRASWGIDFQGGSRKFTLTTQPLVELPDELEIRIRITPTPEAGDRLKFTRWFRSRWLDPVFAEDVPPDFPSAVTIGNSQYQIYDGVLITEPTLELDYVCEFPVGYGLTVGNVAMFAGKKSGIIDTVLPREMARAKKSIDPFGGGLRATLHVDDPKLDHFYGYAWTLPRRR